MEKENGNTLYERSLSSLDPLNLKLALEELVSKTR